MKKNKGFTLVELLVVIAIIGLLSTLAVITYADYQKGSRDSKRYNDIGQVRKAMEQFFVQNERYPKYDPINNIDNMECDSSCDPGGFFYANSLITPSKVEFLETPLKKYIDPAIKFNDPINSDIFFYRYVGNPDICGNPKDYGTFLIIRTLEKKQTDRGNYNPDEGPFKDFCGTFEVPLRALLNTNGYVYLFTWPKK